MPSRCQDRGGVIKLVIKEDGTIGETEVVNSSGYTTLDQAALDLIRRAGPFLLTRPLDKPTMTLRIPINYALRRS